MSLTTIPVYSSKIAAHDEVGVSYYNPDKRQFAAEILAAEGGKLISLLAENMAVSVVLLDILEDLKTKIYTSARAKLGYDFDINTAYPFHNIIGVLINDIKLAREYLSVPPNFAEKNTIYAFAIMITTLDLVTVTFHSLIKYQLGEKTSQLNIPRKDLKKYLTIARKICCSALYKITYNLQVVKDSEKFLELFSKFKAILICADNFDHSELKAAILAICDNEKAKNHAIPGAITVRSSPTENSASKLTTATSAFVGESKPANNEFVAPNQKIKTPAQKPTILCKNKVTYEEREVCVDELLEMLDKKQLETGKSPQVLILDRKPNETFKDVMLRHNLPENWQQKPRLKVPGPRTSSVKKPVEKYIPTDNGLGSKTAYRTCHGRDVCAKCAWYKKSEGVFSALDTIALRRHKF